MAVPYKIIVTNQNLYKEFELTKDINRVCLGTTSACEFRLDKEEFFESIELNFELREDKWNVICNDEVYLSVGDARKLRFSKLMHGDCFEIRYASTGSAAFSLEFSIDFEAEIPKYNRFIDISDKASICIGTDSKADVILTGEYCNRTILLLEKNKNGFFVWEKESPYGIRINGKRIQDKTLLSDYDFLSVSDAFFYLKNGQLFFDKDKAYSEVCNVRESEADSAFTYPVFIRNTRRKIKVDNSPIKVLDPSAKPTKPEMNLVTSLMPAIVMFALVVVLRGIMSTTMGTYIIFSICSMGLGVFTTVVSLIQDQKKYKKDIEQREETYKKYIEKKEKEIWEAREAEITSLNDIYYSPAKGIKKVLNFESDSFDRIPSDEDFLDVFVGIGRRLSQRQIEYKAQERLEEGDELAFVPEELHEKYKFIDGAPITLQLRTAGVVGIVGTEENRYQFFKNMVSDIICRQFCTDVIFYLLINNNVSKYDWIRQLPQLQPDGIARNIVYNDETKAAVFEELFRELTLRSEDKAQHKHIIIFALDENGITNHPLSRFFENATDVQATFVFFEKSVDFLPLYCTIIIELEDSCNGIVYSGSDRTNIEKFTLEPVSDSKIMALVTKISPIYSQEINLESSLRKSISMFELLGIYTASDIDLKKSWSESKVYDSIAAPIGVNSKNEVISLDLHEKAHGPHGLVAGTTGSGKSELLQTYILSCALKFHPYEIGFVIIDFKGGGMANQFRNLPHLIGTITNIDGKEIERSLKSIKAELVRRQELFARAGVNQIDKYVKLYKEHRLSEPLPHLIIIVDEFAELKAEQPEFMKELISTARIGRSLGVHLILATQKPAGQVNEQIWSNSRFKICLKVQTQEDSNEVLRSPLAAEIREPGRAYLQVGNNEIFELFQSGYSGGPEKTEEGRQKSILISTVDFKGKRSVLFQQKPEKKKSHRTQLEAIVDYVADFCRDQRIRKLPDICLPPLEKKISFREDFMQPGKEAFVLGIYDDPDHQKQEGAEFSVGETNTIIIGSSQTGKTNLLQLMIREAATQWSPSQANIYIIDFGSMYLRNYETLHHVGGVVTAADEEKIRNLFKLLTAEVRKRGEIFLNCGLSSYSAYLEAGYTDMARIILMLDNFSVYREMYTETYDEQFVYLCREGQACGISIVITNANTNGLGYKYLSNFGERIALSCNNKDEYFSLFDRCRLYPEDIPGRAVFKRGQNIYEMQTFLAFEGEREIDRSTAVRTFITQMNEKWPDEIARRIPAIPEKLDFGYIENNWKIPRGNFRYIIGLDYENVEPVWLDLMRTPEFAVTSRDENKRTEASLTLLNVVCRKSLTDTVRMYIIDALEKPLKSFENQGFVEKYTIDFSAVTEILGTIEKELAERYQLLVEEGPEAVRGKPVFLVVIHNNEAISYISSDKSVYDQYKKITERYKSLGVCFMYTNIEDAAVLYNGPMLLKHLKENAYGLVLSKVSEHKFYELPGKVSRTMKPLNVGDAYLLNHSDMQRIRLVEEK